MRILILGAGALGGYFGARLLAAGRDVTFLVRPSRALTLARTGLNILSPSNGDLHLTAVPTVLAEEITAPYDLILLSAKAYDLASAMDAIAPAVGPATTILPMLNGMAHMAVLDRRFGAARVLGGTCFISAVLDPDGTIRHLNARELLFFGERADTPPNPRMPEIATALLDAGFSASHRPNILQDQYEKWSFLATLAGITCLMRASVGTIVAAGGAPLSVAMFREAIAIAGAEGFRPSDAFIAQHDAILTLPGSTLHASMLRDLQAGGQIETQQIVGDLLTRAQQHGIAAPLLTVAHAHLRCYEEERAAKAAGHKSI